MTLQHQPESEAVRFVLSHDAFGLCPFIWGSGVGHLPVAHPFGGFPPAGDAPAAASAQSRRMDTIRSRSPGLHDFMAHVLEHWLGRDSRRGDQADVWPDTVPAVRSDAPAADQGGGGRPGRRGRTDPATALGE